MTDEPADMFGLPEDEALRQQLLAQPVGEEGGHKWAKTLVEYVLVLESLYLRQGYTAEQAFKLAKDGVLELAEHRGGKVEYLPRGDLLRTALTHAEIYRKCNGRNHDALSDEYEVSVIQIYRICKKQQALHMSKRQGKLALDNKG